MARVGLVYFGNGRVGILWQGSMEAWVYYGKGMVGIVCAVCRVWQWNV